MPRQSGAGTRNLEPSYTAWKAEVALELRRRHGLEATAITERIWTQFYVHRLSPKEASDGAEMVYHGMRPPDWLNRKRKRKK